MREGHVGIVENRKVIVLNYAWWPELAERSLRAEITAGKCKVQMWPWPGSLVFQHAEILISDLLLLYYLSVGIMMMSCCQLTVFSLDGQQVLEHPKEKMSVITGLIGIVILGCFAMRSEAAFEGLSHISRCRWLPCRLGRDR